MLHVDPTGGPPAARPLAPGEVLRLARGERPNGVPDDPRTRAIARVRMGDGAWAAFDRARHDGYLVVAAAAAPSVGPDDAPAAVRLWGWWCAAARRPEAVVRLRDGGATADLAFDLSPARVRFASAALAAIGRVWGAGGCRWLVTEETVQVAGLPVDRAVAVAAGLLRLAADRRYALPEEIGAAGTGPT